MTTVLPEQFHISIVPGENGAVPTMNPCANEQPSGLGSAQVGGDVTTINANTKITRTMGEFYNAVLR